MSRRSVALENSQRVPRLRKLIDATDTCRQCAHHDDVSTCVTWRFTLFVSYKDLIS